MSLFTSKQTPTVLITGGAGFIGSMTNKVLTQNGCKTIILDNLSTGSQTTLHSGTFIEGDLEDQALLKKIFSSFPIEAVLHFAANTDNAASLQKPAKYYQNNVSNSLLLFQEMVAHGVKKLVFSSSAAIYGLSQQKKIREEHPKNPITPYGKSKLMVEMILEDFEKAYNLQSVCLRYFNAAGGDPEGKIHTQNLAATNLIPLILKSIKEGSRSFTIFGNDYPTPDGTCVRDYIHVYDLAIAHALALQKLFTTNKSYHYNLGSEKGYSVQEILDSIIKFSCTPLSILYGKRRPADPASLVADATKAKKELGWKPKYESLEEIIESSWSGYFLADKSLKDVKLAF